MFDDFKLDDSPISGRLIKDLDISLAGSDEDVVNFVKGLSENSRNQLELLRLKQAQRNHLRRTYKDNIIKYVVEKLGHRPWEMQAQVLKQFYVSIKEQEERRDYSLGLLGKNQLKFYEVGKVIKKYICLDAGHNLGKCVHNDDLIQLGNGYIVKAKELISKKFPVITVAESFPVESVGYATNNNQALCFEIKTEAGLTIRRTDNHPFFNGKTWVQVKDLKVGDSLFSLKEVPAFNGESLLDEITVKLLAYLCSSTCSVEEEIRTNFAAYSQLKSAPVYIVDLNSDDLVFDFHYCLSTFDSTLSLQPFDDDGKYIVSTYNPALPNDMFYSNWPDIFGQVYNIDFLDIYNIRVPQQILSGTRYNCKKFLSTVFKSIGTGEWTENDEYYVGFSHVSEAFIDDLNFLLRRFGIIFIKQYDEVAKVFELKLSHLDVVFNDAYGFSLYNFFVNVFESKPLRKKFSSYKIKFQNVKFIRDDIVEITNIGMCDTVAIHVPATSTYHNHFYEHNTALLAYCANFALDMFDSINYAYAPTYSQLKLLFFKELASQRKFGNLPGQILESGSVKISRENFLVCRATKDDDGSGTERLQGQHNEYIFHFVDEAEEIDQYVFDAIESMISGGVSVVFVSRNPRTTVCPANMIRYKKDAASWEISCLDHPNVIHNKELIPGSVTRDWVDSQIDKCETVPVHDSNFYTFEVQWREGIFKPTNSFLWRVLGIATGLNDGDKVIPIGTFKNSSQDLKEFWFNPYSNYYKDSLFEVFNLPEEVFDYDLSIINVGIDVARFGADSGKIYLGWGGMTWLHSSIEQERTKAYIDSLLYGVNLLISFINFHLPNTDIYLSIRIDSGGGYDSGISDSALEFTTEDFDVLNNFNFQLYEVHFNSGAFHPDKYDDFITEAYFNFRSLLEDGLKILSPNEELRRDLTLREYDTLIKVVPQSFGSRVRKEVLKLKSKKLFKSKYKASPDDGDAIVLCNVSEELLSEFGAYDLSDYEGMGVTHNATSRWR